MFNLNKTTGNKKSLEQILDVFKKTSDELTEFIKITDEENVKLSQQIDKLERDYVVNGLDIKRATKTLDKIKNILGE